MFKGRRRPGDVLEQADQALQRRKRGLKFTARTNQYLSQLNLSWRKQDQQHAKASNNIIAESSQTSQKYQYTALDEEAHQIRLLTLLPGAFSSEIRLCLDTTHLTKDHIPKYEAVSYAWGSAENRVNIFVGESGQETLAVTQNLAQALQYFRYEDKPRVLWIDAICVDQENLEERGQQVKRMADLYSNAAKVLIWLGPESHNSDLAIDFIKFAASKVGFDQITESLTALTDEIHWAFLHTVIPLLETEHLAIADLINRPWFERLWVWQEVHLAKGPREVICGKRTIAWESLIPVIACLYRKGDPYADLSFYNRITLVNKLCSHDLSDNPMVLLDTTKNSLCSDPRDKIYALLSLSYDSVQELVQPDYAQDVYEVYRHAVVSIIKATRRLSILNSAESHEHLNGVPTWVPDLSVTRISDSLNLDGAFITTYHSLQLKLDDAVLKVEGVIVDKIEKEVFLDKFNHDFDIQELPTQLKQLASIIGLQAPFPQNPLLKTLARTLCVNMFYSQFLPPTNEYPTIEQCEEIICKLLKHDTGSRLEPLGNPATVRTSRGACTGRSLYITTKGTFGLGPRACRSGDVVANLLGLRSAFLLRPTNDGKYKVIGEAYCDGFMDHETLLGPLPNSCRGVWKYFEIAGWQWAYLNQKTGDLEAEDPRLGPLPPGWRMEGTREDWNWKFVNDETGESTEEDPRLASTALRARGVPIKIFELV